MDNVWAPLCGFSRSCSPSVFCAYLAFHTASINDVHSVKYNTVCRSPKCVSIIIMSSCQFDGIIIIIMPDALANARLQPPTTRSHPPSPVPIQSVMIINTNISFATMVLCVCMWVYFRAVRVNIFSFRRQSFDNFLIIWMAKLLFLFLVGASSNLLFLPWHLLCCLEVDGIELVWWSPANKNTNDSHRDLLFTV